MAFIVAFTSKNDYIKIVFTHSYCYINQYNNFVFNNELGMIVPWQLSRIMRLETFYQY